MCVIATSLPSTSVSPSSYISQALECSSFTPEHIYQGLQMVRLIPLLLNSVKNRIPSLLFWHFEWKAGKKKNAIGVWQLYPGKKGYFLLASSFFKNFYLFIFLAKVSCMQNLRSLSRDQTHAPCSGARPPGKSLSWLLKPWNVCEYLTRACKTVLIFVFFASLM